MTKKDYELIAQVFAKFGKIQELDQSINWTGTDLAHNLADALQIENPRFNREMFLKACGVNA